MPRLRVQSFSISIDGFGAGANQSWKIRLASENGSAPMGFFQPKHFSRCSERRCTTGVDDEFAARVSQTSVHGYWGATCSARSAGPCATTNERLWGDNPPYHTPVFVLTHHARELDGRRTTRIPR